MMVMEFVKVEWPTEILELFKVFNYLGSMNRVAFGINWFYESDTKIVYLAQIAYMILPIIIIILSTLFWGIFSICRKNPKYVKNYNIGSIYVILFLVHNGITMHSL